MIELLLWPFIAGLVLTAIHAWFGLHVLARGVVFVDLALAQMAALGLAVALLADHPVQSDAAYWYALGFALGGAVLFSLVRPYERTIQQEAVIGIVYAVSAAVGVLALDRAPQGSEHIKQLLIGSILTVTPQEVGVIAVLYGAIGVAHAALRRPLLEVSFEPRRANAHGRRALVWDIVFYASFALVVTSSVRIAGVLLVFSYLIVPAALAGVFARGLLRRLLVAWALGIALTSIGLAASWVWDLPTGPAIVAVFGGGTALVGAAFGVARCAPRTLGRIACAALALTGALLAAFPRMDQPWLDALERVAPALQTVFLTEYERTMRDDMLDSIARAEAELARLRTLEQDVRWGRRQLDAEKTERLRQYLAGRSEISAGEHLVLRNLRDKARDRQRLALGVPLLLAGVWGLYALSRRRATNAREDISSGHFAR